MMFVVKRELELIDSDNCSLDEHVLSAQYIINKYPPIDVIKTVGNYEKVICKLRESIQANLDNPPERSEYPQIFRNVCTLNDLLESKKKGIIHVRGSTAYNGCNACKDAISGKTYLIDDLIKEYQKHTDSPPYPTKIPHPGCTTDCYDETEGYGNCRCSWSEIPPDISNPDSHIDPEFIDWLNGVIEENSRKYE